jgi:hypothetical protein
VLFLFFFLFFLIFLSSREKKKDKKRITTKFGYGLNQAPSDVGDYPSTADGAGRVGDTPSPLPNA